MINRILIRIKAIQILYSFLLVEKHFNIEGAPSNPTKEKRFAYSLYLDMLVLLVRVASSVERRNGDYPLKETKFISRLLLDDTVQAMLAKYRLEPFPYERLVAILASRIEESGIYKKYLKIAGKELEAGQEHLWRDIFNVLIITAPELHNLTQERQNYTLKGFERMKEMMNRTFVNFLAAQDNVREVENALRHSLDTARDLYFRLLYLPVELTDMQDRVIDENSHKFLKTEEDINPNMKFVQNRVVDAIRCNETIDTYVSKHKLSWRQEDPVMMQSLLKAVTSSDTYREYMEAAPEQSQGDEETTAGIHADGELWRNLFKRVILENPVFLESLEEKSVFWNDDLEIISTFVAKSLKRLEDGESATAVLDQYKDDEDARFGYELIRHVYAHKDTYRLWIEEAVKKGSWEAERLAFMDVVILETALAEIMNYPKIPLTVSVNEYIELAKSYSTSKSGQFVHGILGTIIDKLQKDGMLLKK